jgi:hypothetical protein
MRRNNIEISSFKYPNAKDAQSKADDIIYQRKNRIEKAKKEWKKGVEFLNSMIKEKLPTSDIKKQEKIVEILRVGKCRKIAKLSIKAWQLQAVTLVGKRGGNWLFSSYIKPTIITNEEIGEQEEVIIAKVKTVPKRK